jgi:chromosome segregation ATPase
MLRIAKLVSILALIGFFVNCGGDVEGQQSASPQSKPVPKSESTTSHRAPQQQNAALREQLAQAQEQLKDLQATIKSMSADQQSMKIGLESAVRLNAQNSLDLAEITHTLGQHGRTIDGLGQQVEVVGKQVDHVATGIGMLLERTDTLPSDLRQIKTRLGLY